jgi:hypothetical protein
MSEQTTPRYAPILPPGAVLQVSDPARWERSYRYGDWRPTEPAPRDPPVLFSRVFPNHAFTAERLGRGLRQSDVADECGVTVAMVTHWLTGRSRPSTEAVRAMSRLFGVPEPDVRSWFAA